ncbi:MAG: phosphatidate cytidylyltransferase [Candidatus Caenarcaniphilales bacterium]|nr:phosphatidate cytidylyltransferase [Candidatus Caenarcaniphilales bacterium]
MTAETNHSENLIRLRSGVSILALVIGTCWFSRWSFALVVAGLTYFAHMELVRLLKASGVNPFEKLTIFLIFFCLGSALFSPFALQVTFGTCVLLVIGAFVVRDFYGPKIKATFTDLGGSILSLVLIGWLAAHVILLRSVDASDSAFIANLFGFGKFQLPSLPEIWEGALNNWQEKGFFLTLLSGLTITANDSISYYAGRAFGRTRLTQLISPNKTIKGSLAGMLAGVIVFFLIMWLVGEPYYGLRFPLWYLIFCAIAINVIAQLGDLAESLMKRSVGFKDSGHLFEGHGGVLDRFDSHLPSLVFTYYFLAL